MGTKDRLIKEYLEQKEARDKNKIRSKSAIRQYDYENDPVLRSLKIRCIELVTKGFYDAARKHLTDYLNEHYPDKVDLELVWLDNLKS